MHEHEHTWFKPNLLYQNWVVETYKWYVINLKHVRKKALLYKVFLELLDRLVFPLSMNCK